VLLDIWGLMKLEITSGQCFGIYFRNLTQELSVPMLEQMPFSVCSPL